MPSSAYIAIDAGYLPHLVYALATTIHQGNQPLTDHQMMARGVSDTSPATCLIICTYPVRRCRKNGGHYSTLTHCIMECLAGPYNGKTTLNCDMSCKYSTPFSTANHFFGTNHLELMSDVLCRKYDNPCGVQPSSKGEQNTKYNICRICTRHVMGCFV